MTTWSVNEPRRLSLDGEIRQLDTWLVHGKVNVVATDGPPHLEISTVGTRGVTVSLVDGVLDIRHDVRRWWGARFGLVWWLGARRRRYRADVSVAVNPDCAADLSIVSGSVVASGLSGAAKVDVVSGTITLLGLHGRVGARTVSGAIEALGIGGELSLQTVSGEIVLADASAHRVQARTISGAVTCDLDNPRANDIRIDTTSGSITVRVPDDADLDVRLGATSGRITSAFAEVSPSGPPGGRQALGRIGAGTGQLSAYAVSGNISLLARATEDFSAPADTVAGGVGTTDPAGETS